MTLTTACMSTPMPRTDPTKPLQKRCEDGQNGHPQTVRLSDHINSSVASLLYALCYTLRRACVSLSYDPCDASLLQHLGCSSFFFFFFWIFSPTLATPGVLLRGSLWASINSPTTRSMSTPQTTPYTFCQGVGIHGPR